MLQLDLTFSNFRGGRVGARKKHKQLQYPTTISSAPNVAIGFFLGNPYHAGESLGCSIFALAVERSLRKLVKRMIHVPKHTKTQNCFGNWVKHYPIVVELPHKSEMAPGAALPYPGLIRARTLPILPQAWLASGRDSSLPPTQLAPLRLNVKASTKFGRMHDLRLGTYRNTNLASVCFRSRIKRFQIFMEIVQALEKEGKKTEAAIPRLNQRT